MEAILELRNYLWLENKDSCKKGGFPFARQNNDT